MPSIKFINPNGTNVPTPSDIDITLPSFTGTARGLAYVGGGLFAVVSTNTFHMYSLAAPNGVADLLYTLTIDTSAPNYTSASALVFDGVGYYLGYLATIVSGTAATQQGRCARYVEDIDNGQFKYDVRIASMNFTGGFSGTSSLTYTGRDLLGGYRPLSVAQVGGGVTPRVIFRRVNPSTNDLDVQWSKSNRTDEFIAFDGVHIFSSDGRGTLSTLQQQNMNKIVTGIGNVSSTVVDIEVFGPRPWLLNDMQHEPFLDSRLVYLRQ